MAATTREWSCCTGLLTARASGQAATQTDILHELAFVDIQAGRHASANGPCGKPPGMRPVTRLCWLGFTAFGIAGTNQFEVEESCFEQGADRAAAR